MRFYFTPRAQDDYDALISRVQKAVDKQIDFLLKDIQHPSLHAKKYDESKNRWQARVNQAYRFYFQIDGDVYVIVAIMKHPK
ncbi:MAG: type II toxin-antitoxin system RelE/ParE family toxin [Candidatus Paceibacterota bacterium]|jgi:mRNA-degrading endonuclease RelE of RelBE toxin-antitoxin system